MIFYYDLNLLSLLKMPHIIYKELAFENPCKYSKLINLKYNVLRQL
jgi:hypothetical protein